MPTGLGISPSSPLAYTLLRRRFSCTRVESYARHPLSSQLAARSMDLVGIVILFSFAVLGTIASTAVPMRLWQIARGRLLAVFPSLNRLKRFATILALVSLFAAVLVWGLVLYIIAMILTEDPSNRIWGVSELGMALGLLGFLYFLFELLLLPATWRQRSRFVPVLIIPATAIVVLMVSFSIYREGLHTERRFDVYDIAANLSKNMTVTEVKAVLDKKQKPFMKITGGDIEKGNGTIQVTTGLGWGEALFLYLHFYDGRLVATQMVGEDSLNDRFPNQPPDIVPTHPDMDQLFREARS